MVKVQKVIDGETGETILYCYFSQWEKKERAIGTFFSRRFEDGLTLYKRLKNMVK
jgi:hypothetical protein